MPVPKQKTAKAKTRGRRSHDALRQPMTSKCSKCGEAKMPHRVCPHCGYYRGHKVLEVQEV
ncbi:MAG TPA: 50S ribosomal protein L32 [Proteobacteria bacterium]|nr:50S ribosomal protein L32 [bacterium BMS3Abin14]HDL53897.1 50S ribosomal protein L32 [Pseudomonadota bacterium]